MNNVASHPLRVLSLCSGYGGLDLAVRLVFPSAVTVCYVEREIPCARILASRMADGSLHPAPIWSDVSTFDGTRWAGCVDLIVAGFPCQPHSVAGKREGTADARWPVWDDIIRIARECSARALFLENVPGLLTSSGGASIAKVRADLDSEGYTDQRPCLLSAAAVGATQKRERLFILAQPVCNQRHSWAEHGSTGRERSGLCRKAVAHSNSSTLRQQSGWEYWPGRSAEQTITRATESSMASPDSQRCGQDPLERWLYPDRSDGIVGNAISPRLEGWSVESDRHQRQSTERAGCPPFPPGPTGDWSRIPSIYWPATTQSAIRGVADGASTRMDLTRAQKLRALGNGVVPIQAALALRELMEDER